MLNAMGVSNTWSIDCPCPKKTPCHTIIFSFRVVGPQSWVLRVTKWSCFLRYPQDTSHILYFGKRNNKHFVECLNRQISTCAHLQNSTVWRNPCLPLIVSLHYALAYLKSLSDNIDKWVLSMIKNILRPLASANLDIYPLMYELYGDNV